MCECGAGLALLFYPLTKGQSIETKEEKSFWQSPFRLLHYKRKQLKDGTNVQRCFFYVAKRPNPKIRDGGA